MSGRESALTTRGVELIQQGQALRTVAVLLQAAAAHYNPAAQFAAAIV